MRAALGIEYVVVAEMLVRLEMLLFFQVLGM
jgi:hypothetical protein